MGSKLPWSMIVKEPLKKKKEKKTKQNSLIKL